MTLRMTWRNLWRRKRRTLITAATVAGGVFVAVTFTGSGDYAYTNMINTSAAMGYGQVTVEDEGYRDSPTLAHRVAGAEQAAARLRGLEGVAHAAPRIQGHAMFASAAKSVGGMFMALDPAQEKPEYNLFLRALTEGAMFTGTDGRGVVVGEKMAQKLNLRLGKKLVYTTTDAHGEIVSEVGRVVGMFKTGVDEIDGAFALIPLGMARAALRYGPDEATLVAVYIRDYRDAEAMRGKVAAAVPGPGRVFYTWRDTQADMASLIAVDSGMNYLSQILVGLLISAGILNTMFMSVIERRREFGVMLAVGLAPARLFGMILLEAFWIGLLGLALGVLVTTPVYLYMADTGLDLSMFVEPGADVGGVLVDPVMKFRLFPESAAGIMLGVFALTLIAGLYPAWRAARARPVESLKTI